MPPMLHFLPQSPAENVRARKKTRAGNEIYPVPVRAVIVPSLQKTYFLLRR